MKRFVAIICIAAMLLATSGCRTEVQVAGEEVECVGLNEDKDPRYEYEYSLINIVGGLVFFQLFFVPPVYVALECLECPTRLDPNYVPPAGDNGSTAAAAPSR